MYDRRTILAGTFGAMASLAGCQSSGGEKTPTEASTATPTGAPAPLDIDYGGWFENTDSFDGTTTRLLGENGEPPN